MPKTFLIDWFVLAWFGACWVGYTYFVARKSRRKASLVMAMRIYRREWFKHMLGHDTRIAHVAALNSLQTGTTFFASTALLIPGGLAALLGTTDRVIELAADLPFAKARPGAISWGNVGAISVNRIYAERLAKSAGVRFNMIPLKGGSEAFQALLGHHLDVYGDPGFGAMATSGKVRLLATMTAQRLKRWPQVPTLRELGHDLSVESLIGLVAPKNLDPAIAARLHAAVAKASASPEGDEFRAYASAQFQRAKVLLAESGFKPE